MKRIILLAVICMAISTANAQNDVRPNVPSVVMTSFTSKYPNAKIRRSYHLKDGSNVVKYNAGNRVHLAYFDNNGVWQKTETSYALMHSLPEKLKKTWLHSGYASWYIESRSKVETPSQEQYVIIVDDINPWDNENKGSMKQVCLTFSSDGQLVDKKQMRQQD